MIDAVDDDTGRDVRVRIASADIVKAALPRPDLLYGHTRIVALSLDELLAGCPTGALAIRDDVRWRYPACQLMQVSGTIEVDHAWHAKGTTIVGLTAAGGAIGLGVCALACDAPADSISGLTLLGGALVAITWGAFVYGRSISAWH